MEGGVFLEAVSLTLVKEATSFRTAQATLLIAHMHALLTAQLH